MFNSKKAASFLLTAAIAGTVLTGCAWDNNKALVKINGGKDEITYGYANFNAKLTQAMYDVTYGAYGSEDMWKNETDGKTFESTVKDGVLDNLEEQYVLVSNAEKYNVKLDDDTKKKIEKAAKEFMKDNDDKAISQLGAKEEYVVKYLTDSYLSGKVKKAIEAKADTTVTDEEANQKKIALVYFNTMIQTTDDGTQTAVTDDEKATMKANAESLVTAEDFKARADEIQNPAREINFGQAELADAKESGSMLSGTVSVPYKVLEAADKLADGERTEVLEDEHGYYVAQMVTVKDEEAIETEKSKLEQNKISDYYNKEIEKLKADITWEVDKKLWKKVKFIDRFKAKEVEQESGTEQD